MEKILKGSVSDIVINDEKNAIYANVSFENSSIKKLYVCVTKPTPYSDMYLLWIVDDNNPTFSYQEGYDLKRGWELSKPETSQAIYVSLIHTIKVKVFLNLLNILRGE